MTRTPFALAAALLLAPAAQAQSPDGGDTAAVDAVLACRDLDGAEAKLACFERSSQALAAALESGRVVVIESPTSRSVDRESFGLSLESISGLGAMFGGGRDRSQANAGPVEQIEDDGSVTVYDSSGRLEEARGVPVDRVAYDRVGNMMIYLSDGQVWRQTGSRRISPVNDRDLDGLTATVSRGALSSYFMTLSHSNRRFRAERIQ